MQSIKNIYEKIYDFENLHKAWEEARKGKRYRDDVLIFNANYEEHLIDIQNQLIYGTYEVGRYHTFYVYEPKKRLIMSLPFKDRMDDIIILHHDKKYLAEVKELLRVFLDENLRLNLNNKTAIRPCSMGIDFVGYRIWATHRRLKKKTAVKIKRNIQRHIERVKAGEESK